MTELALRPVAPPDFANLTPTQKHQFQYIAGYTGNLAESVSLTQFYAVVDEKGAHLYDMHLFCGDDGQVFEANTTHRVASFSQGGATADDAALEAALDDAVARFRARTPKAKATKTPKTPSKKTSTRGRAPAKKKSTTRGAARKARAPKHFR